MPNVLFSGSKLVKLGHKIILNDPIATIINKLTNEVVMEAKFDPRSCTWNVYLDRPEPLGLDVQKEKHPGVVIHLANNAY